MCLIEKRSLIHKNEVLRVQSVLQIARHVIRTLTFL